MLNYNQKWTSKGRPRLAKHTQCQASSLTFRLSEMIFKGRKELYAFLHQRIHTKTIPSNSIQIIWTRNLRMRKVQTQTTGQKPDAVCQKCDQEWTKTAVVTDKPETLQTTEQRKTSALRIVPLPCKMLNEEPKEAQKRLCLLQIIAFQSVKSTEFSC